jgi:hypothetical protein
MSETTKLEDFISETELMTRFGLKSSMLNRARKRQVLPCYQVGSQGPRLYLKNEVTDFFLSCRTVFEPKSSSKRRIKRKTRSDA